MGGEGVKDWVHGRKECRITVHGMREFRMTVHGMRVFRMTVHGMRVFLMTVHGMREFRMTVHEMRVFQMTVHEMRVFRMTVHGMSVFRLTVHGMSVFRLTVHGMSVFRMTVDLDDKNPPGSFPAHLLHCGATSVLILYLLVPVKPTATPLPPPPQLGTFSSIIRKNKGLFQQGIFPYLGTVKRIINCLIVHLTKKNFSFIVNR